MSRPAKRTWISLAVAAAIAMSTAVVAALPSAAQQTVGNVAARNLSRTVTFEQRLLLGLRVKTASDARFIADVVEQVRLRRLPVRLVDSTFFWARNKAARRGGYVARNPMVYFRPAMTIRARALGVTIR